MADDRLSILSLAGSDTLVIKKSENSRFFITTQDSFIIGVENLIFLMNFLVKHEFIHPSVLEGILEEVNTE